MQLWKVPEDRGLLFCLTPFLFGWRTLHSQSVGITWTPAPSRAFTLGETGLLTKTQALQSCDCSPPKGPALFTTIKISALTSLTSISSSVKQRR